MSHSISTDTIFNVDDRALYGQRLKFCCLCNLKSKYNNKIFIFHDIFLRLGYLCHFTKDLTSLDELKRDVQEFLSTEDSKVVIFLCGYGGREYISLGRDLVYLQDICKFFRSHVKEDLVVITMIINIRQGKRKLIVVPNSNYFLRDTFHLSIRTRYLDRGLTTFDELVNAMKGFEISMQCKKNVDDLYRRLCKCNELDKDLVCAWYCRMKRPVYVYRIK